MTFRLGDRALWRSFGEECVVIGLQETGYYRVRPLLAGLFNEPRICIASAQNLIPLPNRVLGK